MFLQKHKYCQGYIYKQHLIPRTSWEITILLLKSSVFLLAFLKWPIELKLCTKNLKKCFKCRRLLKKIQTQQLTNLLHLSQDSSFLVFLETTIEVWWDYLTQSGNPQLRLVNKPPIWVERILWTTDCRNILKTIDSLL